MKNKVIDILLVEDRAEDAELCMMAFQEHNLTNKIYWAKGGQEALDFLFAKNEYIKRKHIKNPKLVLLDLKMPKVDGIEVLRQIRANSETKSIPVVMLTTSSEEKDIVNAYKLYVNSYIVKPVDFGNFSNMAKELGLYWTLLNKSPNS